jgi:hypothetical protein
VVWSAGSRRPRNSGPRTILPLRAGRWISQAIEVAGDTIGELEQDLARANRDLEDTRTELDEALERRGLFGWLASRIDSLGFGFGWWTLYFAILMPWMKGQTPGKRAMGLRVVRLDGQPITGWHAFERAGGYAAGIATGTLGFLQIYWDANRQAIHDKVAGTAVIQDGVPGTVGPASDRGCLARPRAWARLAWGLFSVAAFGFHWFLTSMEEPAAGPSE